MATIKEIQNYIKSKYGFEPKSCWIADVKEQCGLPVKKAWNRQGKERLVQCPANKVSCVQEALEYFGMLEKR